MDYDQKDVLEDLAADFANFMSAKDYVGARTIVDQLAELKEYDQALLVLKTILKEEMLISSKV